MGELGGGVYRAGETLTETETHRETETYKKETKIENWLGSLFVSQSVGCKSACRDTHASVLSGTLHADESPP